MTMHRRPNCESFTRKHQKRPLMFIWPSFVPHGYYAVPVIALRTPLQPLPNSSYHVSSCRSCASLGYFNDAILPLLHKSLPSRKPPIINRGTWARHAVMRQITSDFVTACATGSSASGGAGPLSSSDSSTWLQPVCQVVALGAGNDSSWFNSRHQGWPLLPAAHFIELDYQEVSSRHRLPCSG